MSKKDIEQKITDQDEIQCSVLKVRKNNSYSSIAQSVEHSAVNRSVVGSSPTWGVGCTETLQSKILRGRKQHGSVVKWLRHRPFTAVTRVRASSESLHGDLAKW